MTTKKLKNFPKDITEQGKLLLCDIFSCVREDNSKRSKKQKFAQQCLFLLEKCIIISDIGGTKKEPIFLYKDHIKVVNSINFIVIFLQIFNGSFHALLLTFFSF